MQINGWCVLAILIIFTSLSDIAKYKYQQPKAVPAPCGYLLPPPAFAGDDYVGGNKQ